MTTTTTLTLRPRPRTSTNIFLHDAVLTEGMEEWLGVGISSGLSLRGHVTKFARNEWASIREEFGFEAGLGSTALLTPPDANRKLNKANIPTYGLTLASHIVNIEPTAAHRHSVRTCPWSGQCAAVCVLRNGHGERNNVVQARAARTALLFRHPLSFSEILGFELGRAARRHGWTMDSARRKPWRQALFLLRPNVNSDLLWEVIYPSLTRGKTALGPNVHLYGYTKNPTLLTDESPDLPNYRLAYSVSERDAWSVGSLPIDVMLFLYRGGNLAVVTNRKPGQPIKQWAQWRVVDADKTDEWMFARGVIGDLSAKGRARNPRHLGGFVREVY